jgi:hypothetical protein
VNLSPNLTLDEYAASQTAARRGMDNSVPPGLLENARAYAEMCFEGVRAAWGGSPRKLNSGYRCPALNAAVGGSKTSQHMAANAGDYAIRPGENIYALFLALLESDLVWDQLILEGFSAKGPSAGWIHVSLDTLKARGDLNSGFAPDKKQRMEVKTIAFDARGSATAVTTERGTAVEWARARAGG